MLSEAAREKAAESREGQRKNRPGATPRSRSRPSPGHVSPCCGREPRSDSGRLARLLARLLGHPVKWVEDRREHFLCAIQERDQYWDVEIALDATASILGVLASCQLFVGAPGHGPSDVHLETDPNRFLADITAYSSSPDETWGDPFLTASGRPVADGVVACPRRLPFGTRVRIGKRTYTCWDRLHPKYDDRFDIWKPSKEDALQFGRQRLIVVVL